jgi:hypothetical protein
MSALHYAIDLAGTQRSEFRIRPSDVFGHPTTGYHLQGEIHEDVESNVWLCVASGTPGTWAPMDVVTSGFAPNLSAGTTVLDTASVSRYLTVKWAVDFRKGGLVLTQEIVASHKGLTEASDVRPASMQMGSGVPDASVEVDVDASGYMRLLLVSASSGWQVYWRRVYTMGPPLTETPTQFRIDTTQAGSATDQFILPLRSDTTGYDFLVDWGDGTDEVVTDAHASFPDIPHTYASPGTYTVSMLPRAPLGLPGIRFNNAGDRRKLLEVLDWGTNVWLNMQGMFWGCSNLTDLPVDSWKARTAWAQIWSQFLTQCTALVTFPWMDLSGATMLNSFFNTCANLENVPEGLQTSKSTTFTFFFVGCPKLVTIPWFDTSSGTLFTSFVHNCTLLSALPAYDTSNGTGFLNFARSAVGLNGSDFPTLNLGKAATCQMFLAGVQISTASYDALLIDLAARAVNNSVLFHGGTANYTIGVSDDDRLYLTGTKLWSITDGGGI